MILLGTFDFGKSGLLLLCIKMSKIMTGFPVIVFLHVERRRRKPLKSPYFNPRVLDVVDGWSTLFAAESAAGAVNPCKVHQVASAYFLLCTGGHYSAEVGSNLKKKHAKQILLSQRFKRETRRVKNLFLVNVFHYLCLKWENLLQMRLHD